MKIFTNIFENICKFKHMLQIHIAVAAIQEIYLSFGGNRSKQYIEKKTYRVVVTFLFFDDLFIFIFDNLLF